MCFVACFSSFHLHRPVVSLRQHNSAPTFIFPPLLPVHTLLLRPSSPPLLSSATLNAHRDISLQEIVSALDGNGDGSIERKEAGAAVASFKRAYIKVCIQHDVTCLDDVWTMFGRYVDAVWTSGRCLDVVWPKVRTMSIPPLASSMLMKCVTRN